MGDTLSRWARAAIWTLPLYGALTLAATVSQQPDPGTQFRAWSDYVTTSWFYASHIGASMSGLALGTLGMVSVLQPVGGALLVLSGALLALRLRPAAPARGATPGKRVPSAAT